MAQNNLAKKEDMNYISPVSLSNSRVNILSSKPRAKVSKQEIVLIISGCVILACLMIGVITAKISLSNAQHSLQKVEAQDTSVKSENTNLRQQISELQSSDRLERIAKENNMVLKSSSIRNVSK